VTKNKGKFGKGKATAVEPTDEFVSTVDRIARRLRPHAAPLAAGVVVAVLAILGYGVWSWYRDRQAAASTDMFHDAIIAARTALSVDATDNPDAKAPDAKAPDETTPGDGPPKQFATVEQRAQAVIGSLDQVDSSKVTGESRLLRAATLLELGRYDEAIALYDQYAKDGQVDLLRQTAREGLGYALEAKAVASKEPSARQKGLEEALAAFATIQPNEEGPGRDVALYHQGRMLALLDRREEAIAKFKKALEVPDTSLKPQLEFRIASLESAKR
jgi:hypothetical protein